MLSVGRPPKKIGGPPMKIGGLNYFFSNEITAATAATEFNRKGLNGPFLIAYQSLKKRHYGSRCSIQPLFLATNNRMI